MMICLWCERPIDSIDGHLARSLTVAEVDAYQVAGRPCPTDSAFPNAERSESVDKLRSFVGSSRREECSAPRHAKVAAAFAVLAGVVPLPSPPAGAEPSSQPAQDPGRQIQRRPPAVDSEDKSEAPPAGGPEAPQPADGLLAFGIEEGDDDDAINP